MLLTSNEINIEIDKKQVYHYLGYSSDSEPPARISSVVDGYVENVHHLIDPVYSYVIRDVERVDGIRVFIEGEVVFKSRIIARLLERCCKVSLFAATIGNRLEEMIIQLADNGLVLQSAVLDAIGSNATEGVADFVQHTIEEMSNIHGLCISQRFSPGYCDWDISQQRMLFKAIGNNSTGIHLTKGYLMIPRKSISGIVGIGDPDKNVDHYNPCLTCDKHDCQIRREV